MISSIPGPIGVVSVAGLYRTGKSYLLNKVILDRTYGFGIGSTTNACTKGLWLWGNYIPATTINNERVNLLIIDSEGLGSLDKDHNHDLKIFSLAVLLSSYFI